MTSSSLRRRLQRPLLSDGFYMAGFSPGSPAETYLCAIRLKPLEADGFTSAIIPSRIAVAGQMPSRIGRIFCDSDVANDRLIPFGSRGIPSTSRIADYETLSR